MESNEDKALKAFKAGFNCAQSVVVAFADDLNYDKSTALHTAVGFGGGMGRLQGTCGAVTGSFMVLGLYNSTQYSENLELKNAAYPMVRQFDAKFKSVFHTTNCKELLDCDLSTEEGHAFAVENRLFEKVCEKCITRAVRIVEELIEV